MRIIFIFFTAIITYSCKNDFEKIIDINKYAKTPAAITENFTLKYTDSSIVKAILDSPLNLDFTNQKLVKNQLKIWSKWKNRTS